MPANMLNDPISSLFGGGTKAVSQLGGNTIYLDPNYVLSNSDFFDAALYTHESLHNLGLLDGQVEAALGLTNAQCEMGSVCITLRLQKDCFPPPSPVLLGGGN